jgi:signal transduction histidine kinase
VNEIGKRPDARILIVDDEAGMREGCRRALTSLGYVVDTAANLAAGRQLLGEEQYDVFLLDVMLPDGSGLDLIAPILERDTLAICIVITGFGSLEMAIEAVRQGAHDFLSKPFTSDELTLAVEQGLERRRLKALAGQAEELARAKGELEKLDEVKSQLMLKVAHELRAPIAAVQSYITLILAGYMADDEIEPTLQRVQDRLQELLDLTSDLLELARLKQAQDRTLRAAGPEPMAGILEDTLALFQEQIRARQQSLRVEIRDRPMITAHREHLEQIWTNLISNAIKYTPEGGSIVISLLAQDADLVGKVADSGMGIAAEDQEHLFQEFFRTDQAKASGQIGTGLGLSIVKQIVDTYGGSIEFSSKPGSGTQFTFILPLQPSAADMEDSGLQEHLQSSQDSLR